MRALGAVAIALCLTACPTPQTVTDAGQQCQCAEARLCFEGRCLPAQCQKQQCGEREACVGQSCEPTECLGVICPAGASCAGGACYPTACGTRACGEDEVCIGSVCVDRRCVGVVCAGALTCVRGLCLSAECLGVACPAGQFCDLGACVEPQCAGLRCDPGERCAAGVCQPSPVDGGDGDAGALDAGPPDAGPPDAGSPDAGSPDAGSPDAGPPDGGADAGARDAGLDGGADAGARDAGLGSPCDAGAQCQSGACADAVCCNGPCGGGCDSCNQAGRVGLCTALPAGAAGSPSCAPDVCHGDAGTCPTGCTVSSQCAAGFGCAGTRCVLLGAIGAECNDGQACVSGICFDCVTNYCAPLVGVCGNYSPTCYGYPCATYGVPGRLGICGPDSRPPWCAPFACSGQSLFCPSAKWAKDFNDDYLGAWDFGVSGGAAGAVQHRRVEHLLATDGGSSSVYYYVGNGKNNGEGMDLRNSTLMVEVGPGPISALKDVWLNASGMTVSGGASIILRGGTLNAETFDGGTTVFGNAAYVAGSMAWWRLRESTGTLYAETAPASAGPWSVLGSTPTPFPMDIAASMGARTRGVVASPGVAWFDNLNVAAAPCPPVIGLSDDFNDQVKGAQWSLVQPAGFTVTETAQGALQIATNGPGGFGGYLSTGTFDLTGKGVFVNSLTSSGNSGWATLLEVQLDANNAVGVTYSNQTAYAFKRIAGATTSLGPSVGLPFGQATEGFVRVREAAGSTVLEIAADPRTTWLTVASLPNPFAMTALRVRVGFDLISAPGSNQTLRLDELNICPQP